MRKLSFFATAALTATMATAGCAADAICGGDDYPATTIGATGRTCVAEGHEPPAGYVRFPPGQEPKRVGDKWDRYWQSHTIDRSGAVVSVRAGG